MLKGAKGTVVKITISREGYTEPLVFTVTRDEIPRHSVDIAFLLKPESAMSVSQALTKPPTEKSRTR